MSLRLPCDLARSHAILVLGGMLRHIVPIDATTGTFAAVEPCRLGWWWFGLVGAPNSRLFRPLAPFTGPMQRI